MLCPKILAAALLFQSPATLLYAGQNPASFPVATTPLTLAEAESIALANQPRLQAAQARANAAAARVRQTRSAYLPTAAFNATGVRVADTGTSTAAGALTTSALSNRFAYGGQLTQLVTDFGRTSALVSSSRYNEQAQESAATLTKAQVRLNVRAAFYQVLGAEAVLHAAQAAQSNRHLVAQQLNALAQSELRSTVDVNFAEVLASEADLAVVRAQSVVAQQRAHLTTAMGVSKTITAPLAESAMPGPLPPAPDALQSQAQSQRADLGIAEAQQKSAQQFATAEKRLQYPTLTVGAAAGDIPFRDHTLHDSYAAAGFNLNIPIFNGGLFTARRAEAESEARARSSDVAELHLEITEQVRNSWQRANEAYQSLAVTDRLVAQSKEALRLARARYDAGLGTIVELNEAQVNETSAEIAVADANYTYLSRRAELDFAAGLLN
ncbi:TolC family protein [Terriglobus aquaticus]|uniref:TolC family protein n=1 Tax=Terriglobus aquaticus TaxID=940139 RepID=A0ABW9KIS4_9BACT|nr:TolC family protein [Terriglobus aquaticus]